jgi:hypothetical protein
MRDELATPFIRVRPLLASPWEPDEGDTDPKSSARLTEEAMRVKLLWLPSSLLRRFASTAGMVLEWRTPGA